MQKYLRPGLIVGIVVVALVLLWFSFGAPTKPDGTNLQSAAESTPTAGSTDPHISRARGNAPTKSQETLTGNSGQGYHFDLSEPPLPFLDNYGSPTTTGSDDMKAINDAVIAYLKAISDKQRPPTGSNAEFTRVLSGDNPLHVAFISQTHIVNGELTDRWGTPLLFHNVSGHQVDVTSAGPDKKFWTSDDVTPSPDN